MIEVPKIEIIRRVFAITADKKSSGSSLLFSFNGVSYFITAAHVLGDMEEGKAAKLYIYRDNSWIDVDVIPFYVSGRPYQNGDIDIAVLKTNVIREEKEFNVLSSENMTFGQDAYFLGFPYFGGAIQHSPEPINKNFPLPFVKKAIVSSMQESILYLDGHNNPGFSGGPVIFWNHRKKKHQISAIISAYLTQEGEIKRIETSTKEFYSENSGIGVAYDIRFARELIEKIDNQS